MAQTGKLSEKKCFWPFPSEPSWVWETDFLSSCWWPCAAPLTAHLHLSLILCRIIKIIKLYQTAEGPCLALVRRKISVCMPSRKTWLNDNSHINDQSARLLTYWNPAVNGDSFTAELITHLMRSFFSYNMIPQAHKFLSATCPGYLTCKQNSYFSMDPL